jgi:hypothetical protein
VIRILIFVILLVPAIARAIPEEEKKRGCTELAAKVLATLRPRAIATCMEFVTAECDRIEYTFRESCLGNSHSDNAIKYDMDHGTASSCQAALMKRETHRTLCDGLRRECRETKTTLGEGAVEVNCRLFRDGDDKRLCVQVEAEADRIIAAEKSERETCSKFTPKAPTPTTAHGSEPQAPAPKLPGKFAKPPPKPN